MAVNIIINDDIIGFPGQFHTFTIRFHIMCIQIRVFGAAD